MSEDRSLLEQIGANDSDLLDLPNIARALLLRRADMGDPVTENGDQVTRGRLDIPGRRYDLGDWRIDLLDTSEDENVELRERSNDGQAEWKVTVTIPTVKLYPDPDVFRPGRLVDTPYPHLQRAEEPEVCVTATDVKFLIHSEDGFDYQVGEDRDLFRPVTITPRHVMLGETWGLGIGSVWVDLSREEGKTPEQIQQLYDRYGIDDRDWRGLYLEGVRLYIRNDGGIRVNEVSVEDVAWGFDGEGLMCTATIDLGEDPGDAAAPTVTLQLIDQDGDEIVPTEGEGGGDPAIRVRPGQTVRGRATRLDGRSPFRYTWTHWRADTPGGDPSTGVISDPLVYYDPGQYTVSVTVRDFDGREGSATLDLHVEGEPVTPEGLCFSLIGRGTEGGNPLNETEERSVYLEGSVPFEVEFRVTEPTGGTEPYEYEWSVDETPVGDEETLSHAFEDVDTHVVAVTVTDDDGETATRQMCVRVFEAPDAPIDDLRLDGARDWLVRPGETRIRVTEGPGRDEPRELEIEVKKMR